MSTVAQKRAEDAQATLFACDFSPPKSSNPAFLEPSRKLNADFISISYNPGKSIRVNSAFAAHWINENTDKDVIFTVSTRDMNKIAMQSLLLGAGLAGLNNVVVVKGDKFTNRDLSITKGVDDFKPTELIRSIQLMNQGIDFRGNKLDSPTDFFVGASIDLGLNSSDQVQLTYEKVKAGAQFFLVQALFDPLVLKNFLQTYSNKYTEIIGIPIFCGVQIMTANSLSFNKIPNWVTNNLADGRSGIDIAIEVSQKFLDAGFRSIYLIPPIFKGGIRDYTSAERVLEAFRTPRPLSESSLANTQY